MSKASQIKAAKKARANKKAIVGTQARRKIQKTYATRQVRISKKELKVIQKKRQPVERPAPEPEILTVYDWAIAGGRREPLRFRILCGERKGEVYHLHRRYGDMLGIRGRYLPLEIESVHPRWPVYFAEEDLEQVQ